MYLADLFGEMDKASEELARSSSLPEETARSDVFGSQAPPHSVALMGLGLLAVLGGLLWGTIA
jgi:hypothetical protein